MQRRRGVSAPVGRASGEASPRMRAVASTAAIVATVLAHPAAALAQTPEARPELSVYLVVLASGLNIREAPDLGAGVVGVVSRGERLCAIRYRGSWAEVTTPSSSALPGRRGFVSRGFVSETRAGRDELAAMGCQVPPPPPPSRPSPGPGPALAPRRKSLAKTGVPSAS